VNNERVRLAVCVDCFLLIGTGEPDPRQSDEERAEFLARFDAGASHYEGLFYGWCDDSCTHDRQGEDCPNDEEWFSWSSCELCRSTLGGSRHNAGAWMREA
jgi:hypothetical protein